MSKINSRGQWTDKEDLELLRSSLKNKKSWVYISKDLKARTENDVKNRYYSLLKIAEDYLQSEKRNIDEMQEETKIKLYTEFMENYLKSKEESKEPESEEKIPKKTYNDSWILPTLFRYPFPQNMSPPAFITKSTDKAIPNRRSFLYELNENENMCLDERESCLLNTRDLGEEENEEIFLEDEKEDNSEPKRESEEAKE